MSDRAFSAFLGDQEHRFEILGKHVAELERLSDCGIGTLFKRLSSGYFKHADIRNVIRMGLIGGGDEMTPQQVSDFCKLWITDRPIIESYPIAVGIMERLWFGQPVVNALIDEVLKDDADAA